jgi:hypothetical protein
MIAPEASSAEPPAFKHLKDLSVSLGKKLL